MEKVSFWDGFEDRGREPGERTMATIFICIIDSRQQSCKANATNYNYDAQQLGEPKPVIKHTKCIISKLIFKVHLC